jgi:hypothetical protein
LPGSPLSPVLNQIKQRLTFDNAAYLEAEKRGFYTGNIGLNALGGRF